MLRSDLTSVAPPPQPASDKTANDTASPIFCAQCFGWFSEDAIFLESVIFGFMARVKLIKQIFKGNFLELNAMSLYVAACSCCTHSFQVSRQTELKSGDYFSNLPDRRGKHGSAITFQTGHTAVGFDLSEWDSNTV